jgi:hemolysin D
VVQPLETGTVTAIYVHDGQRVAKGQVLVELEPTETQSDRDRLKGELAAARLEAARLEAVALGRPLIVPPGVDPAAAAIAAHEARSESAETAAKLASLDQQIAQHRAELASSQAEEERLKTLLPLAVQRVGVFTTLQKKGYGSRLQLIEAEEKQQDTQRSLEVQQHKAPELEAQILSTARQRAQADAESSKTTLAALTEAQTKAASLVKDLAKAQERLTAKTLLAPVDGTVQELAIHTVGGVVQPGQTVMRVAPTNAAVEVEARLENKDIGFVRAGMPAEVKVETFPFTRYGVLHAKVLTVSDDAMAEQPQQPSQSQADRDPKADPDPHYLVRLALERDTIDVDGKRMRLTPGMMVSAEIRTGKRRVISYILSPLSRATHEAGRER